MTKKKKIIISVVCIALVISCIVAVIIFATAKKFSIRGNELDFNNHTKLTNTTYDSTLTAVNYNIYQNGTQIVRNTNGKRGVYSYNEGKLIIDTQYTGDMHLPLVEKTEDNQTYFKMYHSTNPEEFVLFDEKGNDLGITKTLSGKTVAFIKGKTAIVTENKNSVKTKVENKFIDKQVVIKDIQMIDQKYLEDSFNYEIWQLTTDENINYINLYKKENNTRTLIQTINNATGTTNSDYNVFILTNGTPMIVSQQTVSFNGDIISRNMTIFDINLNKKGSCELNRNILDYYSQIFYVGNSVFYQCKLPGTENKHNLVENNGLSDVYYNLETYKINYKNGKLTKVNFDYVVTDSISSFDPETTLLNVKKIKNKLAQDSQVLLINERLQTKELDYSFNTIHKINNNRYLTSTNGTSNFNIIDKKYKLISSLSHYNTVFATQDSIIASNGSYTNICNLDGVVINTALSSTITNIYNDKYYMVTREVELTSGVYTQYFICDITNLGGKLIHSEKHGETTYQYNNKTYNNYSLINDNGVTLQVRIIETATSGLFDYEFYTIENELIGTLKNEPMDQIFIRQSTDDYAILLIGDKYLSIDR